MNRLCLVLLWDGRNMRTKTACSSKHASCDRLLEGGPYAPFGELELELELYLELEVVSA